MLIKHFSRNAAGRDLIVGDIHGHFTKLQAALDEVGFNPDAGDRLFSVGDLVDRGPESDDALEWLSKPWFHAVQGNHEGMAIDWAMGMGDRQNYAANGGAWNIGNTPPERLRFSDALGELPLAIEIQSQAGPVGIIHADCPMGDWGAFVAAMEDPSTTRSHQKDMAECAMWSRDRIQSGDASPVAGLVALVVGHSPVQRPTVLGNVHYIDTGGWHDEGGFTFLEVGTLSAQTIDNTLADLDAMDATQRESETLN
jgi:serine/threonine protein phosphatase 1